MNESPATASLRSATSKKNVPCFSDFARDRFFLKMERTFFFGVLPVKIFGQCGGAKCNDETKQNYFCGRKRILLCLDSFLRGFGIRHAGGCGRNARRGNMDERNKFCYDKNILHVRINSVVYKN